MVTGWMGKNLEVATSSQVVVHSVDEEVVHPAVLPSPLRRPNLGTVESFEKDWTSMIQITKNTKAIRTNRFCL